jgi:hypothetical protein
MLSDTSVNAGSSTAIDERGWSARRNGRDGAAEIGTNTEETGKEGWLGLWTGTPNTSSGTSTKLPYGADITKPETSSS